MIWRYSVTSFTLEPLTLWALWQYMTLCKFFGSIETSAEVDPFERNNNTILVSKIFMVTEWSVARLVTAVDVRALAARIHCRGCRPGQNRAGCHEQVLYLSIKFSVVDPDPHWFRSAGSGSRRAKLNLKKKKSEEISCFEVLDVLFWRRKASPVAWTLSWRPMDTYIVIFEIVKFYINAGSGPQWTQCGSTTPCNCMVRTPGTLLPIASHP